MSTPTAPDYNITNTKAVLLDDVEQLPSTTVVSVSRLSLSDKLQLISGTSLWTLASVSPLPVLNVTDGPHGVRKPVKELSLQESFPATCFPTAAALACSWDPALIERLAVALSKEAAHYRVSVLLGPGMNLKRHPAGGRNFEYFSEDPYLTAQLATAYVRGLQASGLTGACLKHFAVNNQESHRFVVDAVVDERTLRELYLRHFEHTVINAQPATIMCAYNKVNGVYCSENKRLIDHILRREWGFEGVVMTDWGATNDRVKGVAAGIDLEMPGSHGVHHRQIKTALNDNGLDEDDLDRSCRRLLDLIYKYKEVAECSEEEIETVDWTEHYDIAYQTAMQCVVLLKNDNNFLPLPKNTSVALIGDFAREHPRYQGMGSSQVHSQKVVTAFDEVKRHTDSVLFAPGYLADDDHPENIDQQSLEEAVEVAQQASVVLLCIGLPEIMESEGFDRTSLGLPAQHNALVDAICKVNPNVVVILSNGGAIESPWAHQPKAILEGYLLGEAGGQAVVDLIFGVQSPCGKLAETFPLRLEDVFANKHFPGTRDSVEYREGLNVGYRYFDSARLPVRYPFGHGLSYTSFDYTNFEVQIVEDSEHSVRVKLSLLLTNAGSFSGKEVVQCYVHDSLSTVYRPDQELKAFRKVSLEPGESQNVEMELASDAFSFYDVGHEKWIIEHGEFEIRIGSSSRDLRLIKTISLSGGRAEASILAQQSYPVVDAAKLGEPVDDITFANRFGEQERTGHFLRSTSNPQGQFHRNSLLKEVADLTLLGSLLQWIVYREAAKEVKSGPTRRRQKRMVRANVENLPLRALVLFSKGGISFDTLDGVIALMNRKPLEACSKFSTSVSNWLLRK